MHLQRNVTTLPLLLYTDNRRSVISVGRLSTRDTVRALSHLQRNVTTLLPLYTKQPQICHQCRADYQHTDTVRALSMHLQ
ncbi:hypothetical protein J6590_106048, partial [Homalodisca vitripennis]